MRRHALASVVASVVAVVAISYATQAAQTDMSRMTCKSLLQALPSDPGGANLMWMSGYLAGRAGVTIFDTERHIKAARQLGYLCRSNPNALAIEVYRRALADNSGQL